MSLRRLFARPQEGEAAIRRPRCVLRDGTWPLAPVAAVWRGNLRCKGSAGGPPGVRTDFRVNLCTVALEVQAMRRDGSKHYSSMANAVVKGRVASGDRNYHAEH